MVTRFTAPMMHSAARRGSIPPNSFRRWPSATMAASTLAGLSACAMKSCVTQRLEDVLDLKPHVVAVADRAELAGGSRLDPGVVGDESERVAHVRRPRLEHEGPLPVVEHAVRGDDPAPIVGGGDQEGVEKAV